LWRMFALGFRLFRRTDDPLLSSLGLGFSALMVGTIFANLFGDRWSYFQVSGWTWMLLGVVVRGHLLADEAEETADEAITSSSDVSREDVLVPNLSGDKAFLS
jgi:hypothetical protein